MCIKKPIETNIFIGHAIYFFNKNTDKQTNRSLSDKAAYYTVLNIIIYYFYSTIKSILFYFNTGVGLLFDPYILCRVRSTSRGRAGLILRFFVHLIIFFLCGQYAKVEKT